MFVLFKLEINNSFNPKYTELKEYNILTKIIYSHLVCSLHFSWMSGGQSCNCPNSLWATNTYGKRESSTRCPVSRGWLAGSFSVTGLGWRTGHTCSIVYFDFSPSNSVSKITSYNKPHTKLFIIFKYDNSSKWKSVFSKWTTQELELHTDSKAYQAVFRFLWVEQLQEC